MLVLRRVGGRCRARGAVVGAALVADLWRMLRLLHRTGIAHGQLDDRHLIVDGDEVGVIDFRGATATPASERLRADEAQLLVTTVLAVGEDDALAAATTRSGPTPWPRCCPSCRSRRSRPRQRAQVREAGVDLDRVREHAAEVSGVEVTELQKLRRVTVRSVVQVVLLVVAFFALSSGLAGLDFADLWSQVRDAAWWFIVAGFLLAQTTRVAQAVSTLGASPTPLPLRPVYALQLANVVHRPRRPELRRCIAVNIRFFQRHGLAAGSSLAIGGLDAISQFVVQVSLLGAILLLTPASLELDLGAAAPNGLVGWCSPWWPPWPRSSWSAVVRAGAEPSSTSSAACSPTALAAARASPSRRLSMLYRWQHRQRAASSPPPWAPSPGRSASRSA